MIYRGTFKNRHNNEYRLSIVTNGSTAESKEITLTDEPFTTEMQDSDETIYKAVKCQSATIKVFTDDFMLDIFTGKAQGTSVALEGADDNRFNWYGYVEPNIYNMPFENPKDVLEINCIDGLSSLQYLKYKRRGIGVVKIFDIIKDLVWKCLCYDVIYIYGGSSIKATTTLGRDVLSKLGNDDSYDTPFELYISENCFFDDKEDGQSDDDVAWNCLEVLEQICQYCGYVCIARGDTVYFYDYDSIRWSYDQYYHIQYIDYNLGNNTLKKGTTIFRSPLNVDKLYTDGTIQINDVYNKVKITADLKTYDNLIPDLFDNATNITKDVDSVISGSQNIGLGMYGEIVKGEDGNMEVLIDRVYEPQNSKYTDYYALAVKYYKSPRIRTYTYREAYDKINFYESRSIYGALLARYSVNKVDEGKVDFLKTYIYDRLHGTTLIPSLDQWFIKNGISDIKFDDYIVLFNPSWHHITNSRDIDDPSITNYPYFDIELSDGSAFFGGDNSYLIISGKYNYHYFDDDPYPFEGTDISEGRYVMEKRHCFLICRLQIEDYYWNGDQWTTTPSTFKLPYLPDTASDDERRADATMFKDLEFPNNVNWRIGTSEKGYMIPLCNNLINSGLPDGILLTGKPKFTMYKPFDPDWWALRGADTNEGQHYKMNRVFLKDFKITAVIGNPTYSDKFDSDTVYSMTIDDNYVKELGNIEYKINTWDNKKPNYSCVAYKDGNQFKYLDKVYHPHLANDYIGIDFDKGVCTGGLRTEWVNIWRIYKQYKDKSIVLNLTTNKNVGFSGMYYFTKFPNKYFMVDSINRDYMNDQYTLKLIEKK